MRKLYIVGNGFDIAHNLPTKYIHFKDYLKSHNMKLFSILNANEIYEEDELWTDFESALGHPSIAFVNKINNLFGFDNVIGKNLIDKIKEELGKWICSIAYDDVKPKYKFNDTDRFFSFNYTDTLGFVYGISFDKIKYIHKYAGAHFFGEKLIFGHNNKKFNGYEILQESYKDVDGIIEENKSWFDELSLIGIDVVEVIGCSYNDIDYPYFIRIKNCCPKAKWILNWYSNDDFQKRKKYIETLKLELIA